MSTPRSGAWLAAPCLAAMLAAGCGQGAGPEPAAQAAAAPVVFRRANGPEPDTLDPQRAEDESSREIIRDLFEGLVGETPAGELVPGAAESWQVSPDGLSWTFVLRADGRWSNGDPLLAEDFVAGLRRAVDPATASSSAALLAPLESATEIIAGRLPPERLGVAALDARRLQLRLQSPTPYLLGLLTNPITFPVHRPSLAEHGASFARPGRLVSNGAYRLDAWEVHSHVQLLANPHFREPPAIGVVRHYAFDAPEAALNRYRAGDLDFSMQMPMARFQWLRDNLPDELHTAPAISTQFWLFNTVRAPTDELRVRQALSMTVDRQRIVDTVTGLGDHAAYGLVPPGTANYTAQRHEWHDQPIAARAAAARELLAAAGYGPARPLRVEVHYNTDENLRRIAVAVASMWREHLGVETVLHNEEFRVLLSRRKHPDQWQVLRLSWRGDYNDASNFLEIISRHGAVNDTGYDDPEFERLLAAAAAELDPAARRRLLETAERRMLEHYPVLPLYHPVNKALVKPWVRGFSGNVLGRTYTRHLSIDTAQRGY
ncbi:MAG TPA: peptide ABC transporter substrate-binding protein [Gammaproteobacteria bacterium]|nr:peptide ABC transporter substrate-binding protein [Gammaproteobacteria bacterium]